jgi:hypothetical protein
MVDPTADPQQIGKALLMENHASLAARYGDNDFSQGEGYQFREWPGELDKGWVNAAARCADYQACEHGQDWRDSESCRKLTLLTEMTGGDKTDLAEGAPWGIDEEHRPAPVPSTFHAEPAVGLIRMILIDPAAQTITEGYQEPGLQAYYQTLGCGCIDIRSAGTDRTGLTVSLIVDDEGRLKPGQRAFRMGTTLFAGRMLLAGTNSEGATVGTMLTLSDVRRVVQWTPEGTDYTPPPPTVIGFTSWEAARAAGLI